MTENPIVTVILPTYKRADLLRRAVLTVLNQSFPRFNLLILDDNSPDDTPAVARDLLEHDSRIRYLRHSKNLGPMGNFDFGLRHIETPFFSILSDDDMMCPRFMAAAVAAFNDHPSAAFVATQVVGIDESDHAVNTASQRYALGIRYPPDGLYEMITRGHFEWTGIMFQRSVIDKVGTLDLDTGTSGDVDYQYRIAAVLPYAVVGEIGAVFFYGTWTTGFQQQPHSRAAEWRMILSNLARDEHLSAKEQNRAVGLARKRFIREMFVLGIRCARLKRLATSRQAARELFVGFRAHDRALFLYLVAMLGEIGWFRRLLTRLVRSRRRYFINPAVAKHPLTGQEALPELPWTLDRSLVGVYGKNLPPR